MKSAVSGEGSFHSAVFLHLMQQFATERSQVIVDDYLRSTGILQLFLCPHDVGFHLSSHQFAHDGLGSSRYPMVCAYVVRCDIYTDLLAHIDDHAGSILGFPVSWFGEAYDLYVVSPTVLFKGIDLPQWALHLTFDVAHIFFYGLQACL